MYKKNYFSIRVTFLDYIAKTHVIWRSQTSSWLGKGIEI